MIDLHRLAVWRAVVASGSVNRAAANLQYSPATISQHIIALQKSVGLTLYQRRGRGIEPTPVGLRLAEESADVFGSVRRLEAILEDLRTGPSPQLTIGCFSSAAKEWLPAVVAEVVAQFPDLRFEIMIVQPAEVPGRRANDIEILPEIPAEKPTVIPGCTRGELLMEECVLVVAADHRFASAAEVAMADLEPEAWVDPDMHGTPANRVAVLACHAAGFEPRFTAGSDDHYAALAMVAAGIGITVLPRLAARDLPAGLRSVPLVDPTPKRRIALQVRDSVAHLDYVQAAVQQIELQAAASRG
ncbi:LysR family transcriptional regulator [Brevibacterium daeguense]|uniref:LysR family transcriptional regulator n=1 Tax=Brevibacterium daeguense TaxID=909936 RepID=A0ABP8EH63_9MICO|nr:LysR substrate-binding domain-containing protein [Brevibacterium daeguense]